MLLLIKMEQTLHFIFYKSPAHDQAQAPGVIIDGSIQMLVQFLKRFFNGFIAVGDIAGMGGAITLKNQDSVTFKTYVVFIPVRDVEHRDGIHHPALKAFFVH